MSHYFHYSLAQCARQYLIIHVHKNATIVSAWHENVYHARGYSWRTICIQTCAQSHIFKCLASITAHGACRNGTAYGKFAQQKARRRTGHTAPSIRAPHAPIYPCQITLCQSPNRVTPRALRCAWRPDPRRSCICRLSQHRLYAPALLRGRRVSLPAPQVSATWVSRRRS